MESCANEGEEVLISVSKCFKCTCQVSCTYSWVWQLCGLSPCLSLFLWGQFAVILVLYFIYKSVAGLSVQSAPALGCVPTEMTQYGRNKAKQFPCSSNKSCTVPPCYPLDVPQSVALHERRQRCPARTCTEDVRNGTSGYVVDVAMCRTFQTFRTLHNACQTRPGNVYMSRNPG